jgi:two-component system cell cycle sensor histidine kinase/response regulator CckA
LKTPLHILHLEDNSADADLIHSTLEMEGIACTTLRVQSRNDFVAALERGGIDLILSDFSLPVFDGMSAAEIVRTQWPAIPLILVSGTLGEEKAVDSFKSGATDYVLKERLSRLAPAVRRAMQEVKERAQLEKIKIALKDSEMRFTIAFEQAPIGMALVSPEGRWLKANHALTELVGYSEAELRTRTFQDITHPDDLKVDLEHVRQLLAGEVHFYQMEKRYIHKRGHTLIVLLSVSLVNDVNGQPQYFISQIQDITARKQLETQFIEAQKMEVIGQLAGGVAHDFNNILGVIIGYNGLMLPELIPDSLTQKCADGIQQAAERAVVLTRQLLIFSRRQTVQLVVLDLNNVVTDTEKMLRRLIDENIEMTVVLGKQGGRVKADAGYIGQVLMNLVVNARDAMPQGGKITITTGVLTRDKNDARFPAELSPGDYAVLAVTDTGSGMTDEVKARLFEAFFTTKPKGKGTGLGLATCATIAKECAGYIDVESELGKGTTFKIYFPQVEQPLDISTGFIKKGPLPRGTETLLLVEDEPSVRHLACSILEKQGYTVLRANNGQEGLHVARDYKQGPISLVVTDVIMPLMSGKVMAEWLAAIYPDIKILFTSGYTDDAIAQHGVLNAGVAFLPKPYTAAMLTCKVRELLDAHESYK